MADGLIQVAPDSTGKKVDTSELTVGANTVERQRVVLADDTTAAAVAPVLNGVPDNLSYGLAVRPIGEDIWAFSACSAIASGIDTSYFTQRTLGTGHAVSQTGGNLVITTGTTTNSEYLARSVRAWRSAMLLRFKFMASQRIANQNFAVLLADLVGEGLSCTINSATSITVTKTAHGYTSAAVGQFMCIGGISGAAGVPGRYAIASIPTADTINFTVAGWPASGSCTLDLFGHSYVRHLYTGTTATNMAWDCQRKGYATGDTTATINTTASPGHMAQTLLDGRDAYLADSLVATATTPNVTARASRVENLPDDNLDLYLYLWSYNGTTSPASTTTWTVGFVSVERFANTPVFIAGNRQQGTQAPLPVNIATPTTLPVSLATNTPSCAATTNLIGDVGVQYRANATGAASYVSVMSPATPAATVCKASAGRLLGILLQNSAAAVRSVKFWNTAQGSVTLGTTAAVFEIDLPAGGAINLNLEGGIGFATAITYAITGAKGLTDNTGSLGANDVTGLLVYA